MPPSGFVQTTGTHFTLDGRPFYFSGANNYYLSYKSERMVNSVLDAAQSMNLRVVRTWGFLDCGSWNAAADPSSAGPPGNKEGVYFHYWDAATGAPAYNDGPNGLQRLDFVVDQARKRGLKLIIPLINNWKDFGGMDQYVAWHGLKFHHEFYTHPEARRTYQNWVSHLLNRTNFYTGIPYKDEPAIMAWELTNEMRCHGSDNNLNAPDCDRHALTSWVQEMSFFIKQNAPEQLVTVGDEGLFNRSFGWNWIYNGSQGTDFDTFLGIPGIDFGTIHSYPDNWGKSVDWGTKWVKEHLEAGVEAGKPVILEEYGWKDHATRDAAFRDWLDAVYSLQGAGDMIWMLAGPQDDGTPYPDYDGYTVYSGIDAPVIASHAAQMNALG